MDKQIHDTINLIKSAKRIAMLTHEDPDIDGIGAICALKLSLESQNKNILAFSDGPIPIELDFLNPSDMLSRIWGEDFQPDILIVFDSEKISRLGRFLESHLQTIDFIPVINIDHHLTNVRFGTKNIVDSNASSTCELTCDLIRNANFDINPRIATFLLAGIIDDTNRFRYSNTNPNTLEISALLMKSGADLYRINQAVETQHSIDEIHLWSKILDGAQQAVDGKVIWSQITYDMRKNLGTESQGMEGQVIHLLLNTKGCVLAILFNQRAKDNVVVELRSEDNIDCTIIAKHFGGGGHAKAAGCRFEGSLVGARSAILSFITDKFCQLYRK
jgi:phosphoesterase RecJ-like protein